MMNQYSNFINTRRVQLSAGLQASRLHAVETPAIQNLSTLRDLILKS